MKHFLKTIFIFISLGNIAYCQPSWVKSISVNSYDLIRGDILLTTPDSQFISIKRYGIYGPPPVSFADKGLILIKFDQNGDTAWTKIYSDSIFYIYNMISDAIMCADSGFIVLMPGTLPAEFACMQKFNKFGNLEWRISMHHPSNLPFLMSMYETANKDIVVSGLWDSHDLFVSRLNSTGALLWSNLYQIPNGEHSYGGGMVEINNEIHLPLKLSYLIGEWDPRYGYLVLDESGNIVSCKAYKDLSTTVTHTGSYSQIRLKDFNNDGFVITGNKMDTVGCPGGFFINNFDSSGNFLWGKSYYIPTTYGFVLSLKGLCKTHDGGFLVTLYYAISPHYDTYNVLVKIGGGGNVKWIKQCNFVVRTEFGAVATPDGGYMFSAFELNAGMVVSNDFLIKTDSTGNNCLGNSTHSMDKLSYTIYDSVLTHITIPQVYTITNSQIYETGLSPDISTICTTTGTDQLTVQSDILFPNPTTSFLNVIIGNSDSVKILDLTGKIVMDLNYFNENPGIIEINVSSLSPGIYLVDTGQHKEKFIKH